MNIEDYTAAMERAVEKMGEDYVHPKTNLCVYFNDDGSPSCILGHVFADLGLIRAEELSYEGNSKKLRGLVRGNPKATMNMLFPGLSGKHYHALFTSLSLAQDMQDAGDTWGLVLKRYKESLESGGA